MVLQEKEARLENLLISYAYLAFDSAHILHSFLWSSTPRKVRQENLDKASHSCLSAVYKNDLPEEFGQFLSTHFIRSLQCTARPLMLNAYLKTRYLSFYGQSFTCYVTKQTVTFILQLKLQKQRF